DFWLIRSVLPAEARQFQHRLASTAWDLCRDKSSGTQGITVGFSGTDDLKAVLPSTIKQENMEELLATNGRQLSMLLRPENDTYFSLSNLQISRVVEHSAMLEEEAQALDGGYDTGFGWDETTAVDNGGCSIFQPGCTTG
ncbi:unnamed protein product, partial [Amoebophrya sp. A25]